MALLCDGEFKGIPLTNVYLKITNIAGSKFDPYWYVTFKSYLSKEVADNQQEEYLDVFALWIENTMQEDVYAHAYSALLNDTYPKQVEAPKINPDDEATYYIVGEHSYLPTLTNIRNA